MNSTDMGYSAKKILGPNFMKTFQNPVKPEWNLLNAVPFSKYQANQSEQTLVIPIVVGSMQLGTIAADNRLHDAPGPLPAGVWTGNISQRAQQIANEMPQAFARWIDSLSGSELLPTAPANAASLRPPLRMGDQQSCDHGGSRHAKGCLKCQGTGYVHTLGDFHAQITDENRSYLVGLEDPAVLGEKLPGLHSIISQNIPIGELDTLGVVRRTEFEIKPLDKKPFAECVLFISHYMDLLVHVSQATTDGSEQPVYRFGLHRREYQTAASRIFTGQISGDVENMARIFWESAKSGALRPPTDSRSASITSMTTSAVNSVRMVTSTDASDTATTAHQLPTSPQHSKPQAAGQSASQGNHSLRERLVEALAPLTRFQDSDLQASGPEQDVIVPVTVELTQEVSYEIDIQTYPGRMPAGVQPAPNGATFTQLLQDDLHLTQQQGPQALQDWCAQNEGSYMRLLPAAQTRLTPLISHGYESPCEECFGKTHTYCTHCDLLGYTLCQVCSGVGQRKCYSCHGHNSAGCSGCGSTGYVSCASCNSSGKIACKACDGDGNMPCHHCKAQGTTHEIGCIDPSVTAQHHVKVQTSDSALQEMVTQCIPVDRLLDYAQLINTTHKALDNKVISTHELQLPVRICTLNVEGQTYRVFAFGRQQHIISDGKLVENLLDADLQQLEHAVKGQGAVAPAIRRLLSSPIYRQLIQAVAHKNSEAPTAMPALPWGTLSDTFTQRVIAAVQKSHAQLYQSKLRTPSVITIVTAAVAALTMRWLGWPTPETWAIAAAAIALTMVVWFVLDWLMRSNLREMFTGDIGLSLDTLQSEQGTPSKWRKGMLIAVCITVGISLVASRFLPGIEAQIQHTQLNAQEAETLSQWWKIEAGRDYQRRDYPHQPWLLQQAEAGNAKAQLTLAWKLILGAGDSRQDLDGAAKWLEQTHATYSKDKNWKLARAAWLIAQPVDAANHQEAAQLIGAAIRDEQLYMMALMELNPLSPFSNPKRAARNLSNAITGENLRAAEIYVGMLDPRKNARELTELREKIKVWKTQEAERNARAQVTP